MATALVPAGPIARGGTFTRCEATRGASHLVDNLNIHQSEGLVKFVAEYGGVEEDLGKKNQRGILKCMKRRAEFLRNPEHRIVFHYAAFALSLVQLG